MESFENWLPSVISVMVVAIGALWASAKHAQRSEQLAADLLIQAKRLETVEQRLGDLMMKVAVSSASLEDAVKRAQKYEDLASRVAVNSAGFKDIQRRLESIEKKLDALSDKT